MKRWALCLLVLSLAVGLASCISSTTSGGSSGGTGGGSSTVTLTATPASITSGSAAVLAWTVNTASISGTAALTITPTVGVVTPISGGNISVSPTATTTYTATLTSSGSFVAMATATVTVTASGGGGGGGGGGGTGTTTLTPTPSTFYIDGPTQSVTVRVTGTGFTANDVFLISPSFLTNSTTQTYVNATEMDYTITFNTATYSPGWITITNCRSTATSCNSFQLAFIGNQNTLAMTAAGDLYQLDQAQGYANPLANGLVHEFSGALLSKGDPLMGQFYNSIAVDDWTYLVDLDGSFWSLIANLKTPLWQMSNNASVNITSTSSARGNACGVYQIANASSGTLLCTVAENAATTTTSAAATVPWPWGVAISVTANSNGTYANNAMVYARSDSSLLRYVISAGTTGQTVLTAYSGTLLSPLIKSIGTTSAGTGGGWWLVPFNSGSATGKVAVLSRPDKALAIVDIASITTTQSVTFIGDPIRIAANPALGTAIVAFADPLATGGSVTRFASVNMATGAVTALTSTSTLLATGLGVSPDGATIYSCSRATCEAVANK